MHRWTRDEYVRLTGMGWFAGQRVELVGGRIIHMPAQKNPHAFSVTRTQKALEAAFGPAYWVRPQMTLDLGPISLPDPDVAVVPGPPTPTGDYPTVALLVVEVSDTTLRYDRGRKARIYARARIADYWIVNLVDGQVEVHRDPVYEPTRRPRYRYANISVARPGDVLSPLAMPGARIPVAELLG
jgi:Uma2 family endonuclease